MATQIANTSPAILGGTGTATLEAAVSEAIKLEVKKACQDNDWREGKRVTSRFLWLGFVAAVTIMNAALFLLMFTDLGATWVQKGWLVATSLWAPVVKIDTSAIEAATRNVIAVLGPMVTGLMLWVITIVAERRLKAYDEAIEKLTDKLEKKLEDFRKTTEESAKDLRKSTSESLEKIQTETGSRLDTFRVDVEKAIDKAKAEIEVNLKRETGALVGAEIDKQKSRLDQAIKEYKAELEQSVSKVNTIEQGLQDRFGAIADVGGYAKTKRGPLASVGRVHEDVSQMFAAGQRDEAVLLVRDMLDQFRTQTGTLRPAGDPKGDWFNLSAVLGRNDEEGLALEVCLAGLEQQNGAAVFVEVGMEPQNGAAVFVEVGMEPQNGAALLEEEGLAANLEAALSEKAKP